jgi:hypothetical protein
MQKFTDKFGSTPHRDTRTGDDAVTTRNNKKDVKYVNKICNSVDTILSTHTAPFYDPNNL